MPAASKTLPLEEGSQMSSPWLWGWVTRLLVVTRLPYHMNFLAVVAGALWVPSAWSPDLPARLAAQYVSFGALFYSGVYCMNAFTGYAADASRKPWRTAYWSPGAYAAWAMLPLNAGFLSCIVLPLRSRGAVVMLYALFLAVNVVYSAWQRATTTLGLEQCRRQEHWQMLFIAVTCPMRVLLGLLVALDDPAAVASFAVGHWLDLLATQWCMFTLHHVRKLRGSARPHLGLICVTATLPALAVAARGKLDAAWGIYILGVCAFVIPTAVPEFQAALQRLWW